MSYIFKIVSILLYANAVLNISHPQFQYFRIQKVFVILLSMLALLHDAIQLQSLRLSIKYVMLYYMTYALRDNLAQRFKVLL
jgi:hypothetical protein